jgi:SAM-dependent methyltransferase
MTHREAVRPELEKFIKKYKKERWKVLEVGGLPTTFKKEFEEWDCEYHTLEKQDDELMEETIKGDDFDLIYACHSFEHCEMPVHALRNFKNHLKKGGYLFMATPNHHESQITKGDGEHIFVLTKMQMAKLLKYVGLEMIDIYTEKNEYKEHEQHWNLITIARKQ